MLAQRPFFDGLANDGCINFRRFAPRHDGQAQRLHETGMHGYT